MKILKNRFLLLIFSCLLIFTGCTELTEKQETAKSKLTETEARIIAEEQCIKEGETLEGGFYNEYTKTWWFDANLIPGKEGCNPACVVSEVTNTAEINWRCTGLIIPE